MDSNKQGAIQVLVVDDSALMRNLVSKIVESSPDLTVAATAMNGKFALAKIETFQPDVICLDLEMPEMNGIDFLKARKERGINIPVIILSSVAQKGAAITMEALNLGASDFIMKPSGSVSEDIHAIGSQLIDLLKYFGSSYRRTRPDKPTHHPSPIARTIIDLATSSSREHEEEKLAQREVAAFTFRPITPEPPKGILPLTKPDGPPGPLEIIAIGISTGGPNALRTVFAEIDANLKAPILVVQHMPPGFTSEFAKSLDRICGLEVKEAADGDLVKPGRVLIAPGDQHMHVERKSLATIVRLDSSPTVNGHRPSADVLFESIGNAYGNRAMGVIMTGMGKDGAQKLGIIYKAGGITLGQDESSSVVYGMPRVAYENGFVTKQVSLQNMASTINQYARELCI